MAAVITLSSTSFPVNSLIPRVHKNNSSCGEGNINPQLSWTLNGLVQGHVSSFEVVARDVTAGNFIHWSVTNIDPNQQSIAENGTWLAGAAIGVTDWGTGDSQNGWNGPCAPSGTDHFYEIYVIARIKPEYQGYVGSDFVKSLVYIFRDNNSNVTPAPTTGECGTLQCPPGTVLKDQKCQSIQISNSTLNGTTYTVVDAANSAAWGWAGTRFYANVDSYVLPLKGAPTSAELIDNDGLGSAVPFTVNTTHGAWRATGETDGRLNFSGVWTNTGTTPYGEWIGFSRCLNVPTTKKYCIGLAADNQMRIKVNGVIIAKFDAGNYTTHFNFWHVIEITLNEGANIIEVEGYNQGDAAGFGAEIYDATITELNNLVTEAQLQNSGYIIYSTGDLIGETFDIGENSGYTCPDGSSYDSCNGGQCTTITYTDPIPLSCCVLIENCKDANDTYLITMSNDQPDLYLDTVYSFVGSTLFTDKCFIVRGLEVCELGADVAGVKVGTNYGLNNCIACDPSEKFESCDNPGTYVYVSFSTTPTLTVGNVYKLSINDNCYTYVATVTTNAPEYTGVTVTMDYKTSYCLICKPCHILKNCKDNSQINVRFVDGTVIPSYGGIINISGDPAILDICWQYMGSTLCEIGTEDYVDVTITKDLECADCNFCNPTYLLTNCSDNTDTLIIDWTQSEPPLDETQTYVFSFNPNKCWNIESRPPLPCSQTELALPPPPVWRDTACMYGFMEKLDWINCCSEGVIPHTVTSVIINGVELVTGSPFIYNMNFIDGGGFGNLNTVTANNVYGLTYTDQVDYLNQTFVSLGIDDRVKAQVVTNDVWAGSSVGAVVDGGFYLIIRDDVQSISVNVTDQSSYEKKYSWVDGVANTEMVSGGVVTVNTVGYDLVSCVDTASQPFNVVGGVVQEPAW